MFQLSLLPESQVATPPTLHELKRAGLAFVAQTRSGYSLWVPLWLGAVAGFYFTADSADHAIRVRDDFNHGVDIWADDYEPTNERESST